MKYDATKWCALIASLAATSFVTTPSFAHGTEFTVTDIANRKITIHGPVDEIILGEGRLLYAVAAIDTESPFQRVVGWRDDLIRFDPQTYGMYQTRFPEANDIPTFGGKDGGFDVEQAISLDPDVIIMNIESQIGIEDAGLDDKLAAVDIPLVYIDFRNDAIANTEPSLRLLGKIFDKPERAQEIIDFRANAIAEVTDLLAQNDAEAPLVFIERAAGYSDECCMSFGDENLGKVVEMAGGRNLAKDIIPGTFGTINPEQVVVANPDHVIATGANWESSSPGGGWVGLGPNADVEEARRKLAALMDRPAYTGVTAAQNGNIHAVWHQFYNSPYQFVVLQQVAKWLDPEQFAGLDPEASFRAFHERFLPVPYRTGYFVSLQTAAGE